jgi:hypothetical protein
MGRVNNTDEILTFYYDETNNIRKLRIDGGKLNVPERNVFVLGGVVHEGTPRPIDLTLLRKAMWIQPTAKEIKLKHVAPGAFPNLLRSPKLTTFLRWILDNNLLIHYQAMDPFFWSVVDIVDSVLSKIDDPMLIAGHTVLKSDLTEILRADFDTTIEIFNRYSYPDLSPTDREPFLRELLAVVQRSTVRLPESHALILKQTLRRGLQMDDLVFIENNAPHQLIEEFSNFYITRIALFNRANHILDAEPTVREQVSAMNPTRSGAPAVNFRFVDSKAESGIQLADVVVGLLGKTHSYLTQSHLDDVANTRNGLTGISLQNIELLRDCIDRANNANRAYLNHITSQHHYPKLDCLLRFADGAFV